MIREASRMRSDAALLFASRVTSAATTVVALVLIAQLRGAEALGAVSAGLAIGGIAAMATDAGLSALLIRESSRRPHEAGLYLGAGLAVRVVSVPVALLVVWYLGYAMAPDLGAVIALSGAGLIGQQTAELTRSVFIARQRMSVASVHAILENVLWIGVVAIGVVSGLALDLTFLLALGVWVASSLAGIVAVRILAGVTPAMPGTRLMAWLRAARPLAGHSILALAVTRLDPILLGLFATGASLETAGGFFAASRLLAAFDYLPEAVSRAVFPELSRRAVAGSAGVLSIIRETTDSLVRVGALAPVILVPAGSWVMTTLFGEAGHDGWILGALAFVVPIRYVTHVLGTALAGGDVAGKRLAATSVALVFVVIVDVLAIPAIGVAATVFSSIGAAVIMLVLNALFVGRRFGAIGVNFQQVLPVAFAAVLCAVAGVIVGGVLPAAAAAALAALVYGLLIMVGARLLRPAVATP